jgi:hypothetical protein
MAACFPAMKLGTGWFHHSDFRFVEIGKFCSSMFINHNAPIILVDLFFIGTIDRHNIQIDSTLVLLHVGRGHAAYALGMFFCLVFVAAQASHGFKVPPVKIQFNASAVF